MTPSIVKDCRGQLLTAAVGVNNMVGHSLGPTIRQVNVVSSLKQEVCKMTTP